jgi:hypothetical protein
MTAFAQWFVFVLLILALVAELFLIGQDRPRQKYTPLSFLGSLAFIILLAAAGCFSTIIGWPK